jgi:hypothetical protein
MIYRTCLFKDKESSGWLSSEAAKFICLGRDKNGKTDREWHKL